VALLHFPRLSWRSSPGGAPFRAFRRVHGKGSRRSVLMANREAEAAGIRPGMALGAAHALASGLKVRERDEAAEARARRASPAGPGSSRAREACPLPFPAVASGGGGSLPLFQGVERLIRSAEEGLSRSRLPRVSCLAPAPMAAELLARAGRRAFITEPGKQEASLASCPFGFWLSLLAPWRL